MFFRETETFPQGGSQGPPPTGEQAPHDDIVLEQAFKNQQTRFVCFAVTHGCWLCHDPTGKVAIKEPADEGTGHATEDITQ